MPGEPFDREQIDRFILDEIDSVPQLEALLLIWNNRPKEWSVEDMARALYVSSDVAQMILKDLASRQLIVEVSGSRGQYTLLAESSEDLAMLAALDRTYRRELVRISTMIHSKASRAVRDFARAFRFTKD
jgi:DNA-binding MarR family transcriptional regulator